MTESILLIYLVIKRTMYPDSISRLINIYN